MQNNFLPITELSAALAKAGFEKPSYGRLANAARGAQIPVTKSTQDKRWYFDPADIADIAKALRLESVEGAQG